MRHAEQVLPVEADRAALGRRVGRGEMPSTARASVVYAAGLANEPHDPAALDRRLTPSRTRATPLSVAKPIRRSRTSSSGLALMGAPKAGIEDVAQAVAERVKPHYDGKMATPGASAYHQPREEFALQRSCAPFRRRRRRAETEEAERGGSEDREAHAPSRCAR